MARSVAKRKRAKKVAVPRNVQEISALESTTKILATPPARTVESAGAEEAIGNFVYFNEAGVFRIGKILGPFERQTTEKIANFNERVRSASSVRADKNLRAFKHVSWCIEGILECDSVSVQSTCEIASCIWIMDALTLSHWLTKPAQTSFRSDLKEVFSKNDTRKKGTRQKPKIVDLRRVISDD